MGSENDKGILVRLRSAVTKKLGDPVSIVFCVGSAALLAVFALHGTIDGKDRESSVILLDTSSAADTSVGTTSDEDTIAETVGSSRRAVEAAAVAETITSTSAITSSITSAPKKTTSASVTTAKQTVTSVTTAATVSTAPTTATSTEPVTETTTAETTTAPETTPETTSETTTAFVQQFPADINSISYEGLLAVPGIGEVTASEIVALRQRYGRITNMRQLLEIGGIGETKLGKFSQYLYVKSSDTAATAATTAATAAQTASSPTSSSSAAETTTSAATASVSGTVTASDPEEDEDDIYVHINSADEDELMRKLDISEEQALDIISVREQIGGFTAIEELLLVESLSRSEISEIKDRILLD